MSRIPNTHGGGARTNVNGLRFERLSNILKLISTQTELYVVENEIYNSESTHVATFYEKHGFYKMFLDQYHVDYKTLISAKLLPDSVIVTHDTVFIIEMKYQNSHGSVDEKLQTCDFKKKQYQKLCTPIGFKVEYIYLLNDWFNQKKFDDVFDYIDSVGCQYFIDILPLEIFGL
jgi:hypothetical protein